MEEGHEEAIKLMEVMAEDFSYALCNAISLFHPETVIIGGIGRKLGEAFLDVLKRNMGEMGFRQFTEDVKIEYTRHGEGSVLRGAAKYYINKYYRFHDMDQGQLFCG